MPDRKLTDEERRKFRLVARLIADASRESDRRNNASDGTARESLGKVISSGHRWIRSLLNEHKRYPVIADYAFGFAMLIMGTSMMVAAAVVDQMSVTLQIGFVSFVYLVAGCYAIDRAKQKLPKQKSAP